MSEHRVLGRSLPGLDAVEQWGAAIGPKKWASQVSIAIAQEGRLLSALAISWPGSPLLHPDSTWLIGSCSKTITATAIYQLRQAGALDVTDGFDVRFSPQTPDAGYTPLPPYQRGPDSHWPDVTLEHLLCHVAGTGSGWASAIGLVAADWGAKVPFSDKTKTASWVRSMALPGSLGVQAYSNDAFMLLGALVEQLGGNRYDLWVRQHQMRPLGLWRPVHGGEVNEHAVDEADYPAWAGANLLIGTADGGWRMTPADLALWASSVADGSDSRVLSADAVADMWTKPPLAQDVHHGWWPTTLSDGSLQLGHGGKPGNSRFVVGVQQATGLAVAAGFNNTNDGGITPLNGKVAGLIEGYVGELLLAIKDDVPPYGDVGGLVDVPSVPCTVQSRVAPPHVSVWARGSDHRPYRQTTATASAAAPWPLAGPNPPALLSCPVSVRTGSGPEVDLFARGEDGQIWHARETSATEGSFGPWSPLDGGAMRAAPAAVSWAPGRCDAFAVDAAGALHHWWSTGGAYADESLGLGRFFCTPAAVSTSPGRLDVFALTVACTLGHVWFDGASWHAEDLGGALATPPSVASWGPGRLDVFAVGEDAGLLHYWSAGGAMQGESLGGSWRGGVDVHAPADGCLRVYGQSPDRRLVRQHFDGTWATPEVGPDGLTSRVAGVVDAPSSAHLFFTRADGALWSVYAGAAFQAPVSLGGVIG
jgi:CubicO group peptidase (beta-lactamase class C family)